MTRNTFFNMPYKPLFAILTILFLCIHCNKNETHNNLTNKTFVEFPSQTIYQSISYTKSQPYTLRLPIQVFNNNLSKPDTIYISARKSLFTPYTEYQYDSVLVINPQTIFDTIDISIQSNKIWEGGTFSLTFDLISKSSAISVSKNYKTCQLRFTRESFISYFSGTYSCFETSTGSTYTVQFISDGAINSSTTYNQNFWDFPTQGSVVPYVFDKINSNTIEIPRTKWTDKLGNNYYVFGNGLYTMNGNFEVSYTIEDEAGKIQDSGIHYFSKK